MMNLICVMLDSLRYDHVGCYGNDWIKTPNLDAFARESAVFTNAYPEGLPTIPVRTALFTGQRTLPYRPWQPLVKEDITVAELLDHYGYTSALITDTYHLFKPDMNFHRHFSCFRWIRGQEADAYETAPHGKNIDHFAKPAMHGDRIMLMLDQYLRNTAHFRNEEDYFAAQVFQEAMRWLEGSHTTQPFFLWVDSFDPHEPWDPPPPYDTMYTDRNYSGPKLIHPKYGPVDWMTEEELAYVRGLYAGEVTFVDRWFGCFMDTVERLGLLDNTLIMVIADHGHPHGDHGTIMKTHANLYSELLRIPFMIRHPDGAHAGERVDALVQTHDVPPTLLDIMGLSKETHAMHGKSVWPVVEGRQEKIRDYVTVGYHESPYRCVRDKRWSFVKRLPEEKDELYDLVNDPKEQHNLIDERPEEAERLESYLDRYTRSAAPQISSIQLRYELSGTAID